MAQNTTLTRQSLKSVRYVRLIFVSFLHSGNRECRFPSDWYAHLARCSALPDKGPSPGKGSGSSLSRDRRWRSICADTPGEGVSDLLISWQTDTPNSYRVMKRPITKSCMRSVLEKQIVRRTNRLIRVRKLMCLLSIFCVFSFPTVCCSASTCRS